ncbi:MAG: hypothetical protein IKC87_08070 [Clostridia bacterium]|nr:hypothetical protein [Clostridia bacterium]
MPFIRTTTNKIVSDVDAKTIKAELGAAISLVSGKAECYLMLSIEDGVKMAYQGDMDTPCAMVEVQLLGKADPRELDDLTGAITKTLGTVLGISADRVYVNYLEFEHWGVSGHNV